MHVSPVRLQGRGVASANQISRGKDASLPSPRAVRGEYLLPREPIDLLLVEDDLDHAALITRLLKRASPTTSVCHVGCVAEAVDTLLNRDFTVVVSDLGLPDARGLAAVEALLCAAPSVPLVVLTQNPDQQLALESLSTGAEEYLTKEDLNGQALQRAIRYAVERHHTKERLSQLAHYDPLTGLANRSLFSEHLEQALQRAKRLEGTLGLMFLDLDGFKEINDTLGHGAGDTLLAQVATRLKECLRDADLIARLGGDEFAIIMEDTLDERHVALVAQRVLERLRAPCEIAGHTVKTTASIGINLATRRDETVDRLLKRADVAMYQAKRAGRDQYRFFDNALHTRHRIRQQSERAVRAAVDAQQFVVHYQPQQSLHTGKVLGAEALLRWKHPTRGLVAPAEFIELLEDQRLLGTVGHQVLQESCAAVARWSKVLGTVRVAVNVSPSQLQEADFAKIVSDTIAAHGIAAASLQLELTEATMFNDPEKGRQALHALREIGVSIAIDDFGTGYCSLAYLRKFPIDMLKIDRTFVCGLSEGGVDDLMVNAIVGLGHTLGCEVLAEGVETQAQFDAVKRLGCEAFQGYFCCAPVAEEEFMSWAAKQPNTDER